MLKENLEEELKNGESQPSGNASEHELDVFISYSSMNKNVADAIVSNFEQHGIRCWYAPRDIMPGQKWVSAIHDAISSCKLFILIFTDSSNESSQVANEVALAFNSGKTLIPFKLSDTEMSSELEYYLTRVHWLDAVKPPLMQSIETLREYSERILGGDKTGRNQPPNAAGPKSDKKGFPASRIIIAALLCGLCIALGVIFISGHNSGKTKDKKSTGTVTEKDTTESGEKASEPDAKQLYNQAYAYQTGEGAENNYLKAYEYYMQTGDAVTDDKDIADAIYELGYIFCNGEGVEQDYVKGIELYKKAIASGNTSAMNMMGNLYLYGDGVDEDLREAEKYYSMAADLGDENGKENLEYLETLK